MHVEVGVKVSQLQVRSLELGKGTFLVKGPLATRDKARKQIQVRTTLGPETFATRKPLGGQCEQMKVDGMGVTNMLESRTHQIKGVRGIYEKTAEIRETTRPGPSSHFAAYSGTLLTIAMLSRPMCLF